AVGLEAEDMKADRLANLVLDRSNRVAGCDATGQVRHIGRIIAVGFFDDDGVAHRCWSFRPDCFKILFSVPGARSPPPSPVPAEPGACIAGDCRALQPETSPALPATG